MKLTNFISISKNYLKYLKFGPIYTRFVLKGNIKHFKVFTHMTKIERLLLYKLALTLKENSTIVEVGSYLGASSLFLASAAREKHHMVYCIDTWSNDAMSEGQRDTFKDFCKNIETLKDFVNILRGYSIGVGMDFNKKIDLLFIDGDHSYEGCKLDVQVWFPKLKDEGIIIFHDFGWSEGVKRVIKEFVKSHQVEEHILDNTYWARIKQNG